LPHIADELEKQINILGNSRHREIINNLKSQFATEIYGQSLQDIDEWLDYFEKYFLDYEFETEKDLTIEFDRGWSILDDEFVLEVRINETTSKAGFKPVLHKTSLRIDIDVVNCKIMFRASDSSKTLKATYETDEQAFALIRNRIEKIYKFDD
jgi:hypothetical protein